MVVLENQNAVPWQVSEAMQPPFEPILELDAKFLWMVVVVVVTSVFLVVGAWAVPVSK